MSELRRFDVQRLNYIHDNLKSKPLQTSQYLEVRRQPSSLLGLPLGTH